MCSEERNWREGRKTYPGNEHSSEKKEGTLEVGPGGAVSAGHLFLGLNLGSGTTFLAIFEVGGVRTCLRIDVDISHDRNMALLQDGRTGNNGGGHGSLVLGGLIGQFTVAGLVSEDNSAHNDVNSHRGNKDNPGQSVSKRWKYRE